MEARQVSARAAGAAREVADWVPPLARAGYAAKGIVYMAVGWLSASAAFGGGGDATGSREAIATVARSTGGSIALWIIGIGLAGYVVWRLVQAFADPEEKGWAKRAAYLASGLVYAGLAFWTLKTALGSGTGSTDGGSGGGWTASLVRDPVGRWVVVGAGIVVVLYGFSQFWRAYRAEVADHLQPGLSAATRRWVVRSARVGLVARGIVMLVIGGLLGVAGWTRDPAQRRGLEGALATLRDTSSGPWLMGLVAAGLVAYGIYEVVQAKYRRINVF